MGPLLLIVLTSLASTFQAINFYFKNDDFAVLYALRNGICEGFFPWPYSRYCQIYEPLYSIFGYNAKPYYLVGLLIWVLLTVSFYFLVRRILDKRSALISSLLLASGYVSGLNFFFLYGIIATLCTIPLFIFSLYLLTKAKQRSIYLLLSLGVFLATLTLFPVRASAYIFSYLTFLVLFVASRNNILKIVVTSLASVVIFAFTYFYIPSIESMNTLQVISRAGAPKITANFIVEKSKSFMQTIGYIFVTEKMETLSGGKNKNFTQVREMVGIIFFLGFLVFLILNKNNKKILFSGIFSLVWITTQYAPQALVSDWSLETTNRYMIFPYIGIVLAIATILYGSQKKNISTLIVSILIILNLIQSNLLFKENAVLSRRRESFFNQLENQVKEINKGSVLFLSAGKGDLSEFNDYIRVGYTPPESAIGAATTNRMENFKVTTDDEVISRILRDKSFNRDLFRSFYWSDGKLVETTELAKEIINNKQFNSEIVNVNKTLGSEGISILLNKQKLVIPSSIILNLTASPASITFPYSSCDGCTVIKSDSGKYLDFIYMSNQIMKGVVVKTTNASEDTVAENIIDDKNETYWVAERDWFEGVKPIISFEFVKPTRLGGLVIKVYQPTRKPTQIEVYSNGRLIPSKISELKENIQINFDEIISKKIDLKVMSTVSDRPSINEAYLIPPGYSEIDFSELEKIKQYPAQKINNTSDISSLMRVMRSGIESCVEWSDKKIPFTLYVDGIQRSYKLDIPSGDQSSELKIGCLNYPVKINIKSVSYGFLSGN